MEFPARPLSATRVKWSGLVVAVVGFFLSRFSVALAVYEEPLQFVVVGLAPLGAGLLLSAFGVALAVSDRDERYVRTVAKWVLVGSGSMLLLVVLTFLGRLDGPFGFDAIRAQAHLVNFLVGGAVGGVVLGVRTAERDQQRTALRNQTSRLVTLNRILRHEVLNAVAVILGHVDHLAEDDGATPDDQMLDVMHERGKHIQHTIDDLKYLIRSGNGDAWSLQEVSLREHLDDCIETARSRYPDATVEYDGEGEVTVLANSMLQSVFDNLLENAITHNDAETPRVTVDVETTDVSVVVTVGDDGPGLPSDQQATLEGDIPDFDDPTSGFGLDVVRLLVEQYRGAVRVVEASEAGTTIAVELLRADADVESLGDSDDYYGMSPTRLVTAVSASLVAGVVMGVAMQYGAGIMPVIGSLYGVGSAVVGWITHLFHSVVFGIIYASLLARVRLRDAATGLPGALAVGLAFGLFLWFFAAGIVMPLWLALVNRPYPFPNLTIPTFVGHVVWGLVVGGVYHYLCD